jgi:DNA repair photolyase
MPITEIIAKSLLRKHKRVDSWFISKAGMNLYRGCTHACAYCDGRTERYYVAGEFGQDVAVKTNAIELLKRELDPVGKRVALSSGYIMLGGGVGDAYQPAEKTYELSRKALKIIAEFGYPVHVLTKSCLVERDVDIIKQIASQKRAIVSFSFSTVDDAVSAVFEPGTSPPSERLAAITRLRSQGIDCGVYLMPVIPFVTDSPQSMDQAVRAAKTAGARFVVCAGMALKPGRQQEHFLSVLRRHAPDAEHQYGIIYSGSDPWGGAKPAYHASLAELFDRIARTHAIPQRVPPSLYRDILNDNDLVVVTLDHIDYYLKLRGAERSPYGYAAYQIAQLKEPLATLRGKIGAIKGVGKTIESVVEEILETKQSRQLRALMAGERSSGRD